MGRRSHNESFIIQIVGKDAQNEVRKLLGKKKGETFETVRIERGTADEGTVDNGIIVYIWLQKDISKG